MNRHLLITVAIVCSASTHAQSVGIDPTFNTADVGFGSGDGPRTTWPLDASVTEICVRPDGKIFVGGDFLTFDGVRREGIARINVDGSLDTAFAPPGTWHRLEPLAIEPSGKVLVLYNSTSFLGRGNIARLEQDGSLDPNFQSSLGVRTSISAVATQKDGKILVVGELELPNDPDRPYGIIRLNSNGSVDAGFKIGEGTNEKVLHVALQSDGKCILTGRFTSYDGSPRNGLVRLNPDGSLDAGFDPRFAERTEFQSILVQPDGRILLIGAIEIHGESTPRQMVRLNHDGSLDAGFLPRVNPDWDVNEAVIRSDGKILISVSFESPRAESTDGVTLLNSDGSIDVGFEQFLTHGKEHVEVIAVQPDGRFIIGGRFSTSGNVQRANLVRLNHDGSPDATFCRSSGANHEVWATAVQPDGKVLIGGDFSAINDSSRSGIARLNTDGSVDVSFVPQIAERSRIYCIAVQSNGGILLGGILGDSRIPVIRLNADGSADASFNTDLQGSAQALAIQPDGKIVIGGRFARHEHDETHHLCRLNEDGSLDTSFNSVWGGPDGDVEAIVLQTDGKILIGGSFTKGIARLNPDGGLDGAFHPGTGADLVVNCMAPQPNGRILIGGNFGEYDGKTCSGLIRIKPNGKLDRSFNVGKETYWDLDLDIVSKVVAQIDGRFIIAGSSIARINPDGSLDMSFDPGTGTAESGGVHSLSIQPDGKIIIGGSFTSFNGIGRNRIARLQLQ